MPCLDSSSGLNIYLDHEDRLLKFDFAKITCSQEISAQTGFSAYCAGRTVDEILAIDFYQVVLDLKIEAEDEKQFVLYLEWEALKAGLVKYLGVERKDIDSNRCQITSIEYTPEHILIAEVILPPQELPKILPCRLAE